jgi:hypothetical protein
MNQNKNRESKAGENNKDQKKWIDIPGLYQLNISVDNFPYRNGKFDHVTITIFRVFQFNKEEKILPLSKYLPENLRKGCKNKRFVEEHIREHFTREETEKIMGYLIHSGIMAFRIHECTLPEDGSILPVGWISEGGGQDHYLFYQEKDYDLPFKIAGYFDVREHTGATLKELNKPEEEKP